MPKLSIFASKIDKKYPVFTCFLPIFLLLLFISKPYTSYDNGMNKPSVFKNTAVITVISCLERALGFLYRIVLARLLGAEGVGIYQIALSHFFLFRTAAGGGIPVTLSRTVSRLNAEGKNAGGGALLAALILGGCIALPLTLILLPLSPHIPILKGDAPVLQVLLPTLAATSAYVAIKGFFWGNKEFFAPALLEMAEEIITVALGVIFLTATPWSTPTDGAKKAALAVACACVLSLLFSVVALIKQKPKISSPLPFLRPMLKTALPITAVRTGSTLVSSVAAVLLPAMLIRAGMTESEALQAFGVATGMVLPVIGIPMTVIGSLAIVLVPELAEDFQKRNYLRLAKNVERSIFFAVAVASMLVPLFISVGSPFGALIYKNGLAGELLSRSAILLLPMSVGGILISILNSLGFERQTFVFSIFGSAAFLLCIIFLPSHLGIYAFPVGIFLQLCIETACAIALLKKQVKTTAALRKKSLTAILLALPLSLFGYAALRLFSLWLGAWLAPILAAAVCAGATVATYALCRLLPKTNFRKKNGSAP